MKDGKASMLGGISSERRAILYITARLGEARIKRESGVDDYWELLFGNSNISCDKMIYSYFVELYSPDSYVGRRWILSERIGDWSLEALEAHIVMWEFNSWVEDRGEEKWKHDKAHFLANLDEQVASANMMKYFLSKNMGLHVFCKDVDPKGEEKCFSLELVCYWIGKTKHLDRRKVNFPSPKWQNKLLEKFGITVNNHTDFQVMNAECNC